MLKRREQIQASEESYMIKKEDAENIIQEVQAAVSKWENLAILPFSYLRCSDQGVFLRIATTLAAPLSKIVLTISVFQNLLRRVKLYFLYGF